MFFSYYLVTFVVTSLFISIAAFLNAKMDKFMIEYMDLTDNEKLLENYKQNWMGFDWRAKYENKQSGKRAYNVFLLKLGIKTRLFSDNCNDAWHFYKSIIIVLFILSISLQAVQVYDLILIHNYTIFAIKITEFLFYGILWNLIFNKTLKR